MRFFLSVLAAVSLSLLSGCASVTLGDPAVSAELKNFSTKKNVGQVYVCRDNPFGWAIKPALEIDGKPQGNIGPNTFSYTELAPGSYKVTVKTPEHDSVMDFSIKEGEQKFFKTWVSMGVFSGWGLVDNATTDEGKACVTRSDLVIAAKDTK